MKTKVGRRERTRRAMALADAPPPVIKQTTQPKTLQELPPHLMRRYIDLARKAARPMSR